MKKLFLLITLLLAAISVAAQSDLMSAQGIYAGPGKLYSVASDVYGTTWGQCAGACTNQCMEAKQDTREECDKLCFDKCHPQPDVITKKLPPISMPPKPLPPIRPEPRTCDDVCALKFKVCEDSQRGTDCKSLFEQCAKGCQPEMSCEGACKQVASQSGDALTAGRFNAGLYVECVTSKCNANCEKACSDAFGVDSKNCILKLCRHETPPPEKCEDKCAVMMKDCRSIGGSDEDCALKIKECVRRCNPQKECPPAGGCDANCADGYYKCSEIAKTMKAEAGDPATVLEYYMMKCRRGVAECLDNCRPVSTGVLGQPDMNAVNPRLPNPKEIVGLNPQPEPPMPAPETRDVSLLGRIWHIFSG